MASHPSSFPNTQLEAMLLVCILALKLTLGIDKTLTPPIQEQEILMSGLDPNPTFTTKVSEEKATKNQGCVKMQNSPCSESRDDMNGCCT